MKSYIEKIGLALKDPILRKRIGFTVLALIVFRLLATIPVPGVDTARLASLMSSNQIFGLLNIFSAGGLHNLSIAMLGVGPFITASIIIQLLTMMFPKWKAMLHDDGEAGRAKLSQYSRILSVPLAVVSAFGLLAF
jgi:preprotein translocase subunit SecY